MSIVNLQSEPIYARSPYIIEVNQTFPANTGSKLNLYLWNNGDTPPTEPTYVLDKLIAAPSKLQMLYNVSNYIREYFTWVANTPNETSTPLAEPPLEWCYIKIERWVQYAALPYELLDTKTYYAFDGYGYYEEGYNPELGIYGLSPGTYDYWYDPNNPGSTFPQPFLNRYGMIRVIPTLNYEVVYTSLGTGTQSFTFNPGVIGPVQKFWYVYPTYSDVGNIVEYKNSTGTVLATWRFEPKEECKYEPVVCDFINKLGSWQRTVFYKVNKTSISVSKKTYNLYNRDLVDYDPAIGQTKVFNVEGVESIKVNTDWVKEEYNELILKPLMLSEVIRINGKPATLKTSSTELFENINNKTINYELEFTYANEVINSVI